MYGWVLQAVKFGSEGKVSWYRRRDKGSISTERMGCSRSNVYATIAALKRKRLIEKVGDDPKTWNITPAGIEKVNQWTQKQQ
jgi:hypothetical protein